MVLGVAGLTWRDRALLPAGLRWLGMAWPLVLAVQVTLGMYTIWTQKAADVATAHVAVGATSLVWGVVTYAALRRWMASGVIERERRTDLARAGQGGGSRAMKTAVLTPPAARVDCAVVADPVITTEHPAVSLTVDASAAFPGVSRTSANWSRPG